MKSDLPTSFAGIADELRLLLCCIRNPKVMSDEDRACVRRLTTEHHLDWNRLIGLAERHRILPFLHDGLRSAKIDDVPSEPWQRIHKKYLSNAVINSALVEETTRLQKLCRTHEIDVLPFKGPILAKALHGDITYRTCDDLDFLVRRQDIDKAREVLLDDGFVPHLEMTESEQSRHRRAGWEYMLRHPDLGYLVELDTYTGPRFHTFELPPDEIFEDPVAVCLDNEVVHTVNPEATLLMLYLHGSRHQWDRLVWIADVLAMWRSFPNMDFERVMARARELGVQRMLLLGHAVARAVARDEEVLPICTAIENDGVVPSIVESCIAGWTQGPRAAHSGMGFQLAIRERARDKIRYFVGIACTPSYSDWKVVRLPDRLCLLYYLIRPFRLLLKAIRMLIGAAHPRHPCKTKGPKA